MPSKSLQLPDKKFIYEHELQNLAITEGILMWTCILFLTKDQSERRFCPICQKVVFQRSRGRHLKKFFARSLRLRAESYLSST